ncbi:hypothetical protein Tco_0920102 [Tanacetum coccineum]
MARRTRRGKEIDEQELEAHYTFMQRFMENLTRKSSSTEQPLGTGSGYQQKGRKPSQNDKTEHGMEKTGKIKPNPKIPKSESIRRISSHTKPRTEEY